MGDFRVHILGCGSALPTLQHYPTAQVVELRDKLFIVDCGEGAQRQFRRQRLLGSSSPTSTEIIAMGSMACSRRWGCSDVVAPCLSMVLEG